MSSSVQHRRLTSKDDLDASDSADFGLCGYVLLFFSFLLLLFTFPFSLLISLKVVQEYQRAVIFRLGRIKAKRAQGPGLFFVLPCVDTFVTVDLRTFTFNVPPQELLTKDSVTIMVDAVIYARIFYPTMSAVKIMYQILTKDSVTVMVDAVIYARIFDPTMSTVKIKNARASTNLLGATTLRTVMGTVGLAELLADRERIDRVMQESLDSVTHDWGIKVERVEIKDVRIPVQMQRAMAAEAESSREAKAKVIAADGELRASRNLKEAADVMASSPTSLQLRYLQTLQTVAEENNHTVMFPIPSTLMNALAGGVARVTGAAGPGAGAGTQQQQPLIGGMTSVDTSF